MADKVKEILDKLQKWWGKFTSKQKTIIIGAAAVVVLSFGILYAVLTQTNYEMLTSCKSTKEASEIVKLLGDQNIDYWVSDDGMTIKVDEKQLSTANLLLGANGFMAAGYGIENVTDGSFNATESDKQKKYKLYLEESLENDFLGMFPSIKTASVTLNLPENDGTLISREEEAYATIVLNLDGEFTSDNASFLAKAIATALGNDTANNITILDSNSNLLYSGETEYSVGGAASSQLSVKKQAEDQFAGEVKKVLAATNEFSLIEVSPNLSIDFTAYDQTDHTYSAAENSTQGVLGSSSIYSSETNNTSNGEVPGTDPNTETTYVVGENGSSSSTETEEKYNYLPNESIKKYSTPAGTIKYEDSSLSVTGIKYVVVNEKDAKTQGLLDGISWEEYKLANSERTRIEVDEDLYGIVSNATGIAQDKIAIVAYTENYFVDSDGLGIGLADVLQIVLIVIILGLLAFVVLKSMASKKESPQEEELSVETLLQSTPERDLEDIEVETKSDTRKLIEKFVDENPEAVANLLRNWLNEDWG